SRDAARRLSAACVRLSACRSADRNSVRRAAPPAPPRRAASCLQQAARLQRLEVLAAHSAPAQAKVFVRAARRRNSTPRAKRRALRLKRGAGGKARCCVAYGTPELRLW